MRNLTGVLVLFVFVAMMIGCGKDDSSGSNTPSTSQPTQVVFPTGTFAATDADGQWRMVFNADSSFALTKNGTPMFTKGRYLVTQNLVVLSDNSSPCIGLGDGTYRWGFNTPILGFVLVSDNCTSRSKTTANNVWQKQ